MFWTYELWETVRRLWREGKTGGEIATIVHRTRNQVLGKLGREGELGFRKPGPKRPAGSDVIRRIKARRASPRRDLPFRASPTPPPEGDAVRSFNGEQGPIYDIMELRRHTCKWPIGEPGDENFCYCGAHTDKGPYCVTHQQVAYVEPLWRIR